MHAGALSWRNHNWLPMPSLTYHLTLLVLRLTGIKRIFNQNPIPYQTLRKNDVYKPQGSFYNKHIQRAFQVENTTITVIRRDQNSPRLLIFLHGGAFVSGPAQHHWNIAKQICQQTDHTIWMCNYPKAPEHQIGEISSNVDAMYAEARKAYETANITIIGDSVGGTLATALVQRLITRGIPVPGRLILVTPVMDATMSNPEILTIDQTDPMLSKAGVLSAKQLCAGNTDLADPMISPIQGEFEGFPPTLLFLASCDIMYPDGKQAAVKMKEAGVSLTVIEGAKMPHIWPFLPVMKEAGMALEEIIEKVAQTSSS